MKPSISIIVPIYNGAQHLDMCLNSLITQTLEEIEILCIDDGSEDNTPKILQAYAEKDSRIKVFMQKNAGTGIARNTGIKHAEGNFIMFCDCDDFYARQMCEKMYDAMQESGADIAKCNITTITSKREIKETDNWLLKKIGLQPFTKELKGRLGRGIWDKIFKKSIIKQEQLFFPPTKYAEDIAFLVQYVSVASSCYILSDHLYFYENYPDSVTGLHEKSGLHQLDLISSFQFALRFLSGKSLIKENLFLLHHLANDVCLVYKANQSGDQTTFFRTIKNDLLGYFDNEDLKDYLLFDAIKNEDDKETVEILQGIYMAAVLGIPIPPGAKLVMNPIR
jgi:glycosyltransferase involved in cell wall biosynthesis